MESVLSYDTHLIAIIKELKYKSKKFNVSLLQEQVLKYGGFSHSNKMLYLFSLIVATPYDQLHGNTEAIDTLIEILENLKHQSSLANFLLYIIKSAAYNDPRDGNSIQQLSLCHELSDFAAFLSPLSLPSQLDLNYTFSQVASFAMYIVKSLNLFSLDEHLSKSIVNLLKQVSFSMNAADEVFKQLNSGHLDNLLAYLCRFFPKNSDELVDFISPFVQSSSSARIVRSLLFTPRVSSFVVEKDKLYNLPKYNTYSTIQFREHFSVIDNDSLSNAGDIKTDFRQMVNYSAVVMGTEDANRVQLVVIHPRNLKDVIVNKLKHCDIKLIDLFTRMAIVDSETFADYDLFSIHSFSHAYNIICHDRTLTSNNSEALNALFKFWILYIENNNAALVANTQEERAAVESNQRIYYSFLQYAAHIKLSESIVIYSSIFKFLFLTSIKNICDLNTAFSKILSYDLILSLLNSGASDENLAELLASISTALSTGNNPMLEENVSNSLIIDKLVSLLESKNQVLVCRALELLAHPIFTKMLVATHPDMLENLLAIGRKFSGNLLSRDLHASILHIFTTLAKSKAVTLSGYDVHNRIVRFAFECIEQSDDTQLITALIRFLNATSNMDFFYQKVVADSSPTSLTQKIFDFVKDPSFGAPLDATRDYEDCAGNYHVFGDMKNGATLYLLHQTKLLASFEYLKLFLDPVTGFNLTPASLTELKVIFTNQLIIDNLCYLFNQIAKFIRAYDLDCTSLHFVYISLYCRFIYLRSIVEATSPQETQRNLFQDEPPFNITDANSIADIFELCKESLAGIPVYSNQQVTLTSRPLNERVGTSIKPISRTLGPWAVLVSTIHDYISIDTVLNGCDQASISFLSEEICKLYTTVIPSFNANADAEVWSQLINMATFFALRGCSQAITLLSLLNIELATRLQTLYKLLKSSVDALITLQKSHKEKYAQADPFYAALEFRYEEALDSTPTSNAAEAFNNLAKLSFELHGSFNKELASIEYIDNQLAENIEKFLSTVVLHCPIYIDTMWNKIDKTVSLTPNRAALSRALYKLILNSRTIQPSLIQVTIAHPSRSQWIACLDSEIIASELKLISAYYLSIGPDTTALSPGLIDSLRALGGLLCDKLHTAFASKELWLDYLECISIIPQRKDSELIFVTIRPSILRFAELIHDTQLDLPHQQLVELNSIINFIISFATVSNSEIGESCAAIVAAFLQRLIMAKKLMSSIDNLHEFPCDENHKTVLNTALSTTLITATKMMDLADPQTRSVCKPFIMFRKRRHLTKLPSTALSELFLAVHNDAELTTDSLIFTLANAQVLKQENAIALNEVYDNEAAVVNYNVIVNEQRNIFKAALDLVKLDSGHIPELKRVILQVIE